jgi:hypothetical protein
MGEPGRLGKNGAREDSWDIAREIAGVTGKAAWVASKALNAPLGALHWIEGVEDRSKLRIHRRDFHHTTRNPADVGVVVVVERSGMAGRDADALDAGL